MYDELISKLDFDRAKYVVVGYFIRKKRDDGEYPPIIDVGYFVHHSIFRQDWRRRVLEMREHVCTVCGKELANSEDLRVVYVGNYKDILKRYRAHTIEQAAKIEELWSVEHGEIRCKEHMNTGLKSKKKRKESVYVYKPSKEDDQYIRDYLNVDGIKSMAQRLHVSVVALREYCRVEGIIENPLRMM